MGTYRKKPVEVKAYQFTANNRLDMADFIVARTNQSPNTVAPDNTMSLFIETLEGTHEAKPGDWIIVGVQGELYPCKPDIFKATYEKVND